MKRFDRHWQSRLTFRLFGLIVACAAVTQSSFGQSPHKSDAVPAPPGRLVNIGGERLHVNCTGSGSPAVLLESGVGDVSVIWSLVQPSIATFTRVCSYDRAGYAWSDPGTTPRTFAQLATELHTALDTLHVSGPFILVGQSYGGLVARGFAKRYPREVAGMVLVDAVHEDEQLVWGGQTHRIRDGAAGRSFPSPVIRLNSDLLAKARDLPIDSVGAQIEPPLDRLPDSARSIWVWAESRPLIRLAQAAEMDWSPEELAMMHAERVNRRSSLGDIPLVVLARGNGGYADGMSISADSLERERWALQSDLAHLSSRGRLMFVKNAGHNIHVEAPAIVIDAIRDVVNQTR